MVNSCRIILKRFNDFQEIFFQKFQLLRELRQNYSKKVSQNTSQMAITILNQRWQIKLTLIRHNLYFKIHQLKIFKIFQWCTSIVTSKE